MKSTLFSKPLRVLRICPNINFGIGHNIKPFTKAISELGVKQTVLSEGIDFKTKTPFSAFRQGFGVLKKIDYTKYDLIHLHNPSFWGVALNAKGKIPIVTTFHGSLVFVSKYFYIKSVKQNIEYLINGFLSFIFSDYVIFVNKTDYDFFSKFSKKCFFVPTGYDPNLFKFNKDKRALTGLFVGRDTPNKNVLSIEQYCKKNNLKLNKILGDSNLTQNQLSKIYADSKYILLFSYSEGFSKVLIEAIASGCIPIVSDSSKSNLDFLGIDFISNKNELLEFKGDLVKNSELIKVCSWKNVVKSTFSIYNIIFKNKIFLDEQKVLLVEPHNDDAILSMGGIILKHPKTKFEILSIVKNNGAGTSKLSKFFPNVSSIQWGMENIHNGDSVDLFFKKNNISKTKFRKELALLSAKYDKVVIPAGISHPMHKVFRNIDLYNSYKFADLPYRFFFLERFKFDLMHLFNRKMTFDVSTTNQIKKKVLLDCYTDVEEFVNVGPGRKVFENFKEEVFF